MHLYTYTIDLGYDVIQVDLCCKNRYFGYDYIVYIHGCNDEQIEYISKKGLTDINLLEDSSQFIIYN